MITDTETPKYNSKQIGGNEQLEEMSQKDKQQLYNDIITTVHTELGEEFRNKKEQYVLNMRNIALSQTDWETVGKQVTNSILDKINNILENVHFSIVSDDKNNYDQPPLASPEIPEEELTEPQPQSDNSTDANTQPNPDESNPDESTDANTQPNPDESTDANTQPNPDESTDQQLVVDTTNTEEEKKDDPAVTGGEKLPEDWMDPEVEVNNGQNGGNKKDKKKKTNY